MPDQFAIRPFGETIGKCSANVDPEFPGAHGHCSVAVPDACSWPPPLSLALLAAQRIQVRDGSQVHVTIRNRRSAVALLAQRDAAELLELFVRGQHDHVAVFGNAVELVLYADG